MKKVEFERDLRRVYRRILGWKENGEIREYIMISKHKFLKMSRVLMYRKMT